MTDGYVFAQEMRRTLIAQSRSRSLFKTAFHVLSSVAKKVPLSSRAISQITRTSALSAMPPVCVAAGLAASSFVAPEAREFIKAAALEVGLFAMLEAWKFKGNAQQIASAVCSWSGNVVSMSSLAAAAGYVLDPTGHTSAILLPVGVAFGGARTGLQRMLKTEQGMEAVAVPAQPTSPTAQFGRRGITL